jgi:hypothetical protein
LSGCLIDEAIEERHPACARGSPGVGHSAVPEGRTSVVDAKERRDQPFLFCSRSQAPSAVPFLPAGDC